VALTLDGAEVDQHLGTVVLGDEAVPLVRLKGNPLLPWPCRNRVLSAGASGSRRMRELLEAKTTMLNPHLP